MISNRSRIPMRPQQRSPEAAQPAPILQPQPQSAGAVSQNIPTPSPSIPQSAPGAVPDPLSEKLDALGKLTGQNLSPLMQQMRMLSQIQNGGNPLSMLGNMTGGPGAGGFNPMALMSMMGGKSGMNPMALMGMMNGMGQGGMNPMALMSMMGGKGGMNPMALMGMMNGMGGPKKNS